MKKKSVSFFDASIVPNTESFASVLKSMVGGPNSDRSIVDQGSIIFIQKLTQTQKGQFVGDLVKLRESDYPSLVDKATLDVHDLEIGKDQSLGEHAAFLFDISTEVLLLEFNRICRTGSLIALINSIAKDDGQLQLHPRLTSDAYQRFVSSKRVRKLEFRLGTVPAGTLHSVMADTTVINSMDIRDEVDAPKVEVTLSMGRTPGVLNFERVKEIVDRLSSSEEMTEKLKISLEGTNEALDMFTDRLKYSTEIDTTIRRLPFRTRQDVLFRAWAEKENEL